MLCGAIAAPLMPVPAIGAVAGKAGYSPAMLHAAIFHAKSRLSFSVWGLASTLNIPLELAETLMTDLARKGITGPLEGATFGGRWAKSNVMEHAVYRSAPAARGAPAADRQQAPTTYQEPDLRLLWAHVRRICEAQGHTLQPCCAH